MNHSPPLPLERVVLDTNAVLDLLLWHNTDMQPLAQALASGSVTLLTDAACLRELRTVLRYAKFGLDDLAAATLYQRYLALIEEVALPLLSDSALPRCRDREDQKFFDLAVRARADALISRDKAVLRLGRHRLCPAHLKIIAPPALASLLPPSAPN
ncbi:putative toxin-antitoxin system toxin component, PIN family [Methyloversatilis thermotolerans]|uniref:putative toxin-antitoxin system toxin component, PIN family n=1 Tax=Methyloversatilis thermotolerans TaxID=1346290 RepID=UPI0004780FB9|nr:putative toxin-antitoxin system toxin component, PIN family [Methyloversatilis thermotolerans]